MATIKEKVRKEAEKEGKRRKWKEEKQGKKHSEPTSELTKYSDSHI